MFLDFTVTPPANIKNVFSEVRDEIIRYLRGDAEKQFSPKCAFTLVMSDLPVPVSIQGAGIEGKDIIIIITIFIFL